MDAVQITAIAVGLLFVALAFTPVLAEEADE
jgi:hypothetical protein